MTSTHQMTSSISIIIPTLNESGNIARQAQALADAGCEVIVVDGGSGDGTVEAAEKAGFKVLSSPPGRGRQLNLGAQAATGDILLFLHADTRLPSGFASTVITAVHGSGCSVGAFRLAIDEPSPALRFIASCANLRSRLLHLPYGDQALFTARSTFDKAGGFAELAIMEDFFFVKKAQKLGPVCITDEYVTTSARRWKRKGIVRTTLVNQVMVAGYYLKIPPEKLALLYDR